MEANTSNKLLLPLEPGPFLDHKESTFPEMESPVFYEYIIATNLGELITLTKK